MRTGGRRALSIVGGAFALAACASLAGLTGGDAGSTARADAGKDAHGVDASMSGRPDASGAYDAAQDSVAGDGHVAADAADATFTCTHAAPVGPPSQPSSGPKSVSFVAALRMFTGGFAPTTEVQDGGTAGFDLDGVCTCPGPPSCASASVSCDLEPGGHDIAGNEIGALFEDEMAAESAGDLNTRIAQGAFSVMFLVEDYNGGPDDTSVLVGILTASNLGGLPQWDGTDSWPIDPVSVAGDLVSEAGQYSYTPAFFTDGAYVNNYQLVAHFPEVTLGLGLGPMTLTGGVLSATIGKDANGLFELTGQLAGRLTTETLFAYAAHSGYYDDAGHIHKLCGADPKFSMLRTSVCGQVDIMGDPTSDNTDAGCNALSFSLGFTSAPAKLGPPVASHYPSAGCDGSVTDCTQ